MIGREKNFHGNLSKSYRGHCECHLATSLRYPGHDFVSP